MELADFVIVNKADGDNLDNAKKAARSYMNALHMFPAKDSGENVDVLTVSSLNGGGIDQLIQKMDSFFSNVKASGYLNKKRKEQQLHWLEASIKKEIAKKYSGFEKQNLDVLIEQISSGKLHPAKAARQILSNKN